MTNNLPIYQNGISLSDEERNILAKKAWSQSRIIAKILKNRPGHGFTFQQMRVTLEELFPGETISPDSVKRAMSTMTGCKGAPAKYQDKYGRWPLIKLDQKAFNPETGTRIHQYAWNDRYGQPPSHREIMEKYKDTKQMNFHKDLFQ